MNLNFDTAAIVPSTPQNANEVLPPGLYTVEVTNVTDKANANGSGCEIELTVIEPKAHERRKIWTTLYVNHSNETTQRIAREQIVALGQAAGIKELTNTDELFGKVVRVRTKIREARNGYPERADIAGYMAAGDTAPPAAASRREAPPAAAKPWERRAA